MAQSGWYDDPDGTPGRLRYFDGAAWTDATRPTPGQHPATMSPGTARPPVDTAAPPGFTAPSVPTAPPGFTAPSVPSAPPGYIALPGDTAASPSPQLPPARGRRRGWLGWAAGGVAAAAVLGAVASLLGGGTGPTTTTTPTAPRTSSARTGLPTTFPPVSNPPVSAPTFAPVTPGTSASVFPTLPDCPLPTATTISDGGLTVTFPASWRTTDAAAPWASTCNATALGDVTAEWAMGVTVGTVDDPLEDLAATAALVWRATVTDAGSYPGDLQPTATIATQQAVTVQGLPGYRVTGQVRVTGVSGVEGDVVTVLVLRLPNGGEHAVVTVQTIGDAAGAATVDAIWASLKVTP